MLELLNQKIILTTDYLTFLYVGLFFLFLLLFIFLVGYVVSKLRSGKDDLTSAAYERSLYLLDNAKKQSLKIYRDSQNRAKKVIESAYKFKSDSQEDLEEHVEDVTKKQMKEFDDYLKEEVGAFEKSIAENSKDALKILDTLSKDLKSEISDSLSDLKQGIEKQTLDSQKTIDAKVTQEYSEIEKDLQKYKEEQVEKVNDRLTELISEVAAKSLGVSFSVNQHKDVILNLLEEAKKRDLLDF